MVAKRWAFKETETKTHSKEDQFGLEGGCGPTAEQDYFNKTDTHESQETGWKNFFFPKIVSNGSILKKTRETQRGKTSVMDITAC
ncbi:hypothetical protein HY250_00405 [Candidatus Azambacteria bacterium]|nr:hypothetical protein [Candidatus Azambacteria bacterium]MBI3684860.1 hypothetical protein [Candidatus Azambacteria bacterium]